MKRLNNHTGHNFCFHLFYAFFLLEFYFSSNSALDLHLYFILYITAPSLIPLSLPVSFSVPLIYSISFFSLSHSLSLSLSSYLYLFFFYSVSLSLSLSLSISLPLSLSLSVPFCFSISEQELRPVRF